MVTPAAWVLAVCHAWVTCSACSHHSWLRTLLAAEAGAALSAMHATARPTAAPACAWRGNPSDTAGLLEISAPGALCHVHRHLVAATAGCATPRERRSSQAG